MKKFISILLAAVIMLSMAVAVPVFAANDTYVKGSVIKAAVTIPGVNTLSGIEGKLTYDTEALEYIVGSVEYPHFSDLVFSDKNAGIIEFNASNTNGFDISSDNIIISAKFNVLDDIDASAFVSTILDAYTLSGVNFVDVSKNSAVSITVISTPPTEPTQATEDTQSTEPTQASQDTEATEPTQASQDTEATEATQATEPTQASQDTEATEATQATEPTQASQDTEATEATQATEPTQSTEGTQATEATQATEDQGYAVTFEKDEHVTINVYHTRDYATSIVDVDVASAVSRERDAGYPDSSGDGQVNFLVVVENGYEIDSVTAAPTTNYKNLKGSEETLADNMYRLTKVTGEVTVTVTAKESAATQATEVTQATEATQSTEVTEATQATEATEPTQATEATQATTETQPTEATQATSATQAPTTAPVTTISVKAAATKIYVGASTTVKATVKNKVGTTKFISSNSKVAKVSSTGKVTGLKEGSVTISAVNNGKKASVKIKIVRRVNPLTAKAKTVTAKAKKTTSLEKAKVMTVKGAQGKVTFTKLSGDSKISINKKTGKLTVNKGLKKGKSYTIRVKIRAAGNTKYRAKSVKLKIKIKVQ